MDRLGWLGWYARVARGRGVGVEVEGGRWYTVAVERGGCGVVAERRGRRENRGRTKRADRRIAGYSGERRERQKNRVNSTSTLSWEVDFLTLHIFK